MTSTFFKQKNNETKKTKINKANFLMSFKKISIYFKSLKIWKTQKDTRLTAKTYLKTLTEKNFNNVDEIKKIQFKNKKYYFEKLENLAINHTIKMKKLSLELNDFINNNNENHEIIESINQKIELENKQYEIDKENLIFSYQAMNYLIQYKPYVYNQEIDETIINIKNNKLNRCNKKILKTEDLIEKLNQKLNKLINPEPKIIKNKNGTLIELERAPIDINKPTKKVLNVINNINFYEARKARLISNKINIEHQFDLIKQQWERNNFHKLITNPYYKTQN